jgi:hypothetical protein
VVSISNNSNHDTEDSSSKRHLQRARYFVAPNVLTHTSSCRNAPAPTGPREQHDSGLLLAVSRPILGPAGGVTDINEHVSQCPISESNKHFMEGFYADYSTQHDIEKSSPPRTRCDALLRPPRDQIADRLVNTTSGMLRSLPSVSRRCHLMSVLMKIDFCSFGLHLLTLYRCLEVHLHQFSSRLISWLQLKWEWLRSADKISSVVVSWHIHVSAKLISFL